MVSNIQRVRESVSTRGTPTLTNLVVVVEELVTPVSEEDDTVAVDLD